MSYIKLSKGKQVLVDADAYEWLSEYKWYYSSTGYAMTSIRHNGKKSNVRMHHMIIGKPKKGFVCDHINRNPLDNQRSNLRIVSLAENARNSARKSDKYPYRGIRPNGKTGWMAYLTHQGAQVYLGTHKTPELAAIAYNEGAKERFGDFAVINQIRGTDV